MLHSAPHARRQPRYLPASTLLSLMDSAIVLPFPLRPILNIPEAANYMRVSVRQIHRLVKARKIRAARIGKRLIFKRAELDRFVDLQTALSA